MHDVERRPGTAASGEARARPEIDSLPGFGGAAASIPALRVDARQAPGGAAARRAATFPVPQPTSSNAGGPAPPRRRRRRRPSRPSRRRQQRGRDTARTGVIGRTSPTRRRSARSRRRARRRRETGPRDAFLSDCACLSRSILFFARRERRRFCRRMRSASCCRLLAAPSRALRSCRRACAAR